MGIMMSMGMEVLNVFPSGMVLKKGMGGNILCKLLYFFWQGHFDEEAAGVGKVQVYIITFDITLLLLVTNACTK